MKFGYIKDFDGIYNSRNLVRTLDGETMARGNKISTIVEIWKGYERALTAQHYHYLQ